MNFAGCIFGFFLLALCAIVARTTYRVPDAVSLDVEVDFPYGDHRQSDAMLEFDRTLPGDALENFPRRPAPRVAGLDPTTPPAPSSSSLVQRDGAVNPAASASPVASLERGVPGSRHVDQPRATLSATGSRRDQFTVVHFTVSFAAPRPTST